MFLAVEPLAGFTELLQVLLLIVAVFLTAAFVITVIMHYRRKKNDEIEPDALQQIVASSPESTAYIIEDEYVLFDHSGLIKDYKTRLANNHARYNALKQDYEKLENKYNSLSIQTTKKLKSQNMEKPNSPVIHNDNPTEYDNLAEQLANLNRSYLSLKFENEELVRSLSSAISGEEGRESLVIAWKEENKNLLNKVADLEYLKEVVEEKKSQISFLQNQLDHRIKNHHQAERNLAEVNEQLKQSLSNWENSKAALERTSNELQEANEKLEQVNNSLQQEQGSMASKQDHILYLENILKEIKDQNEMLQAEVSDQQQKISNLGQMLEDEQSRRLAAEQRLGANRILLQRIYKEFAACMEGQSEDSPVVPLRPAYISSSNGAEWQETTAVQ
jgi:chromosome segregation ATPase